MAKVENTLRVSEEAARAFQQAPPEEQLRLETLVSLHLLNKLQPRRSLDEVIEEMSRQAHEQELTSEKLEELLCDDD